MKRNVYAFFILLLLTGLFSEATAQLAWRHHGPEALGNRTRSIIFDSNGDLLAASAGGGIYKSTNKGVSWLKMTGYTGNPTVTALAANGNTLYAGTGELEFLDFIFSTNLNRWQPDQADGTVGWIGQPGTGVYVSTDNGATWSNENATTRDFQTLSYEGPFRGVHKITVGENGRVFVATAEGLFYTDDDFNSMTKCEGPDEFKNNIVFDVETSGSTVFAGSQTELYISTDNGQNFSKAVVDPIAQTFAQIRVEIAVSPDNPDIVYVGRSSQGSSVQLRGIFRSDDRGQNWRSYSPSGGSGFNPLGNNSRDAFVMAVKPGDPDALIVTGNSWFIFNNELGWTQNGIQHFNPNNILNPGKYLPRPIYTVVFNPNDPEEVIVGTGTDIMLSNDRGETFKPATAGYGGSNLYRVGAWGVEGQEALIAGTDDHGVIYNNNYWKSQITPNTDPSQIDSSWSPATKRFGTLTYQVGSAIVNTENASDVALSYIYPGSMVIEGNDQGLVKSDGTFGSSFSRFYSLPLNTDTVVSSSGEQDSVVYRPLDGIAGTDIFINRTNATTEPGDLVDNSPEYPMHAFALDEWIPENYVAPANATMEELLQYPDRDSIQKLPHYLYYTSKKYVWLVNYALGSTEGLNPRWDRISNNMLSRNFNEFYTCVTPVSDGSNTVYIGTSRGKIFRIDNAPVFDFYNAQLNVQNVIEVTAGAPIDYTSTMDGRWVTSIAVNPENPGQIFVTFAGYGGDDPISYAWYVDNANTLTPTFRALFAGPGGYEQVYSSAFVRDPATEEIVLLAGSESGLYSTRDLGDLPTWTAELPAEFGKHPVYDIYVRKYKTVIVDDRTSDFRLKRDNTIFIATLGGGIWSTQDLRYNDGRSGEPGETLPIADPAVSLYPNPSEQAAGAAIKVELPAEAVVATAVYTLDGRQVMNLDRQAFEGGKHTLALPARDLQPGLYLVEVRITDGQQTRSRTIKWIVR